MNTYKYPISTNVILLIAPITMSHGYQKVSLSSLPVLIQREAIPARRGNATATGTKSAGIMMAIHHEDTHNLPALIAILLLGLYQPQF